MILSNDKHKDRYQDKKDVIDHCDSNEELCSKIDAAGTDPNRYKNLSGEESAPDTYVQKPDNHPSADETMINPDRGN